MPHLSLTAAPMFSIEMTKAVLAQHSSRVGVALDEPWKHVDIEILFNEDDLKAISLTITFHNNQKLEAATSIMNKGDGWVEGTCSVLKGDLNQDLWGDFFCKLHEGKLVTTAI